MFFIFNFSFHLSKLQLNGNVIKKTHNNKKYLNEQQQVKFNEEKKLRRRLTKRALKKNTKTKCKTKSIFNSIKILFTNWKMIRIRDGTCTILHMHTRAHTTTK